MTNKAEWFNVYLGLKLLDEVMFTGYTEEEARKSLIEHDGYDPRIVVVKHKPERKAR